MCVNYRATRADLIRLSERTGWNFGASSLPAWREDIWPDFDAPAVLAAGDGAECVMGVFGAWPKRLQPERRVGAKKLPPFDTVNARGEEVGTKRLYAAPWRAGQRCLIPAGYVVEPCYPEARLDDRGQWARGKNVWHRVGLTNWEPYAVAGIWKRYDTPQGPLIGVSMLTVNADGHAVMGRMHRPGDEKRSVVILRPADYDEWLHTKNVEAARAMLRLYPAEDMVATPHAREGG